MCYSLSKEVDTLPPILMFEMATSLALLHVAGNAASGDGCIIKRFAFVVII